MPELPEVENLRLGLARTIINQKIKKVVVNKPKLVSGKGTVRTASTKKVTEFIKGLTGEKFLGVERRAKNLIFKLTHGKIILAHLKMSGQFAYQRRQVPVFSNDKAVNARGVRKNLNLPELLLGGHPIEISESVLPNKHTHIIFELDNGTLYYNDTRMFGYLLYYPSAKMFDKKNHFQAHGVEPLSKEFTLKYFTEKLKNTKGKIKVVLMEQKIVTGLGNIYADESLFESGIHPARTPASLSKLEVHKLHKAIIRILKRAIKVGGSSVATYRLLDTSRGNYAREHKVYGKEGIPCVKCKRKLVKIIIASRTTIFCKNCQG